MPQKTLGRASSNALPPQEPVAPVVARNRALAAVLLPPAAALLVLSLIHI